MYSVIRAASFFVLLFHIFSGRDDAKCRVSPTSTSQSTDSSLGEYGDPYPDPSTFNEDGSFIGQYVSSVDYEMTAALDSRLTEDPAI